MKTSQNDMRCSLCVHTLFLLSRKYWCSGRNEENQTKEVPTTHVSVRPLMSWPKCWWNQRFTDMFHIHNNDHREREKDVSMDWEGSTQRDSIMRIGIEKEGSSLTLRENKNQSSFQQRFRGQRMQESLKHFDWIFANVLNKGRVHGKYSSYTKSQSLEVTSLSTRVLHVRFVSHD
jgi:hypothetical protein